MSKRSLRYNLLTILLLLIFSYTNIALADSVKPDTGYKYEILPNHWCSSQNLNHMHRVRIKYDVTYYQSKQRQLTVWGRWYENDSPWIDDYLGTPFIDQTYITNFSGSLFGTDYTIFIGQNGYSDESRTSAGYFEQGPIDYTSFDFEGTGILLPVELPGTDAEWYVKIHVDDDGWDEYYNWDSSFFNTDITIPDQCQFSSTTTIGYSSSSTTTIAPVSSTTTYRSSSTTTTAPVSSTTTYQSSSTTTTAPVSSTTTYQSSTTYPSSSTTTGVTSIGDAVDNTSLTWTTGGHANWYGQAAIYYYGGDAAQSGAIAHNQSSWVETTVTGSGTLTFYWKVSSESSYDYLRFYIDGVEQSGKISGNIDWQQKTHSIASGSHTLKWAYTKDGSVNSGSDAGWLDKVLFTTTPVSSTTTYASSSTTTYRSSSTTTYRSSSTTTYRSSSTTTGQPVSSTTTFQSTSTIPGTTALSFSAFRVDDDSSENSSGNNNGIIDPGEIIELYVTLKNTGSADATGVTAELSTSDPYVGAFLFNTSSNYPDIPDGGTEVNTNDFDFPVDPSCPLGHVITFDLTITSNEGSWTDSFKIVVGRSPAIMPWLQLLLLDD